MGRHRGDSNLTRAEVLQAEVRRRQTHVEPYRPGWRALVGLCVVLLGITSPIWIFIIGITTGRW